MEQMDELRRPEAKTLLMYRVVCVVSGLAIASLVGYAIAEWAAEGGGSLNSAGLALAETSFPQRGFADLAAYLSVASVLFFYTGLMLRRNKVARWSHLRLASLQLLGIGVAFASGVATMYFFMLWSSYSSAQILSSSLSLSAGELFATPSTPWGVILCANLCPAILVISGYGVFFLRKVHQVRGLPDYL